MKIGKRGEIMSETYSTLCPDCGGAGWYYANAFEEITCSKCKGFGRLESDLTLTPESQLPEFKIINLPFLPEFQPRLLDGKKTCTSRNKKYGNPGDRFQAFGEWFEFTGVKSKKLRDVEFFYYAEEGFNAPLEFRDCWCRIHPRAGWTPDKKVWMHFLRPGKT